MNKKIILAAVAFVAVIAIFLGVWALTRPQMSEGTKSYKVTVVHGDGTKKEFNYRTDRENLADALLDEGLLVGDITQYGLTVHTVDGEKADWNENQSYWAFYLGEDYAMSGIYDTDIEDGETYKLVYTIG